MEVSNNTPPQFGYRSYAEIIKNYLIYGRFYAGWTKHQGKYRFSVMYAPQDPNYSGRYRSQVPIGYQMEVRSSRYGRQLENPQWVLRVYTDGTAVFRRHLLYSLRYNAMRDIQAVLDFYFYVESQATDREVGANGYRVEVLRRKALNPYHTAPNSSDFGRFLENKYNLTQGEKKGARV